MLYCTKCRTACDGGLKKCPNCSSGRNLREIREEDYELLHRMDEYTAGKFTTRLEEASIPYKAEPYSEGGIAASFYDGSVMPTDKNLFVPHADYPKACELAAETEREVEQERGIGPEEADEEFEDMPRRKRIVVQIVSVLAFIVLIIGVVLGADAIAAWLKEFFIK